MRKITETRKRTGEIIDQRARNYEANEEKQSRMQQRYMDEQMHAQKNLQKKHDQDTRVHMRKQEQKNNTWRSAAATK
jgi:hypothetical protein